MRGVAAGFILVFGCVFGNSERAMIVEHALKGRAALIEAVFFYAFPLALGFFLITLMLIGTGRAPPEKRLSPPALILAAVAILWGAGQLSRLSGLGIAPDEHGFTFHGGIAGMFIGALKAYVTTYGWPLMLCALAAGVELAFEFELWRERTADGP